jgi:hypothetical protein
LAKESGFRRSLEVAKRVGLISEHEATEYIANSEEIGRMLGGLIGWLEQGRHF